MTRHRRATIVEVRPARHEDGHLAGCSWVAVDSAGRQFGGCTADEAQRMAETYNGIRSVERRSVPTESDFSNLE